MDDTENDEPEVMPSPEPPEDEEDTNKGIDVFGNPSDNILGPLTKD